MFQLSTCHVTVKTYYYARYIQKVWTAQLGISKLNKPVSKFACHGLQMVIIVGMYYKPGYEVVYYSASMALNSKHCIVNSSLVSVHCHRVIVFTSKSIGPQVNAHVVYPEKSQKNKHVTNKHVERGQILSSIKKCQ